ncbi:alpha-1,3-mannosyl-glycoprotein 4-beta-N-acetylglucosaminyltransferase B-like [Haliotis cracherodii]|uniref:alpha-1,3-mannosyl-glycoprotein 4-beta-N-acetylglucosaminyltransferase B-like n=1 Tax=Haliotis cracherodii TaxID=6455 RepID=UPI0039EB4DCA
MRMRVKLKNVLIVTSVLCFTPLLWLSLFAQNEHNQYEELLEKRFADLRDRLQYAESLNRQRENDLYVLRTQFNYLLEAVSHNNGTNNRSSMGGLPHNVNDYLRNLSGIGPGQDSIHLPSIFTYLPYLVGRPERMRPAYRLTQGRHGVSIVIGVPTIKRDKVTYLTQTLRSLVNELNPEEKDDCLIIVFIAEPWDTTFVERVAGEIREQFPEYLDSGLLEVIAPPSGFYPDLDHLKETFGDSKERIRWRTKQNLDYSFLMLYARSRGVYYVQLEDDVMAKPGYLSIMKSFAYQQKTDDWLLLEFSALGFIGKMFKSADIPLVVEFFLMFYAEKPIDWLLDHLLQVKVCSPEKDHKHCNRMKLQVRRRFKPSLFQHVGLTSSLKGKVQKLKDKDFGKQGLYRAHVNPAATLGSSLKTYQKYTLVKAYIGETFYWATSPSEGDVIDVKLNPPILLEKFLFRTGNTDHTDDRVYDGTIEVLPETPPDNPVHLPKLDFAPGEKQTKEEGYYILGVFDDQGICEGDVPEDLGKIAVLRIHFQSDSNHWLVISEIHVKERKQI